MSALRTFFVLIWKDFKVEFRGRQFVISAVAFGILLELILGIALDSPNRLSPDWDAGVLWLSLFFASAVSMNRHDLREREMGAWQGLVVAPIDRSILFYAKWVSSAAFVLLAQLAMTVAFFVMLNQPRPQYLGIFMAVLVGGAIGLTGVGTFLGTLTSKSSMRDVLFPLMLFPMTIPLFLALIRLTSYTFQPGLDKPAIWIEVLLSYIGAFVVLPWLLYESLMEV